MATYDQLTEWAGLGHVARARRHVVAGWRIPDSMKAQLVEVGIPVVPRLIERVVIQSEADPGLLTSRGPLYCLTEQVDPDEPAERSSFGVEPWTGAVYFVMPDGESWFANSSVDVWLDALHRYGRCVTASEPLSEPDDPAEYVSEEEEEQALAELDRLAEELKAIDPRPSRATRGFSGRNSWTDGSTDHGHGSAMARASRARWGPGGPATELIFLRYRWGHRRITPSVDNSRQNRRARSLRPRVSLRDSLPDACCRCGSDT